MRRIPILLRGVCVANSNAANVEEVFIDLCRQMLRKDDEMEISGDYENGSKYDSHGNGNKRKRRRILKDHPRCVIL